MTTAKKRTTCYLDSDLTALLREKSAVTGAPVGELIRRAIRLSMFADGQSAEQLPEAVEGEQC